MRCIVLVLRDSCRPAESSLIRIELERSITQRESDNLQTTHQADPIRIATGSSRMADKIYYVRSRGRIRGPFSRSDLNQLIQRKQISRFDRVSIDKKTWVTMDEIDSLHAVKPNRSSQGKRPPKHKPTASESTTTDDNAWVFDELADIAHESRKYELGQNLVDARASGGLRSRIHNLLGMGSLILVFVLLVSANLPTGLINSSLTWWWSGTDMGELARSIYFSVMAVVIAPLVFLTFGKMRTTFILSFVAIGLLVAVSTGIKANIVGATLLIGALVMATGAMMLLMKHTFGQSANRTLRRGMAFGSAGLLFIGAMLIASDFFDSAVGDATHWRTYGMIIGLGTLLPGLILAILGIVRELAPDTRPIESPIRYMAIATWALPALIVIMMVLDRLSLASDAQARLEALSVFRISVQMYAICFLAALGIVGRLTD